MTMPESVTRWRNQKRAELLARRRAIGHMQRRTWNAAITSSLITAFPFLQWSTIGFYWPIKGEVDPRFALRHFRKGGATGALAVVIRRGAPLEFRVWWPGVPSARGVFDLPVPQGTAAVRPQALLIPPVGFDSGGYRLGYGGGFFDRTLATLTPHPLKIALAFELSRIDSIDPQPHDVPMDFIITEQGVHHATAGGLKLMRDHLEACELASQIIALRCDETNSPVDQREGNARYASPPCYAAEIESRDERPSI